MPGPSPDANLAEVLSRWTDAFGWADRAAFLYGDDLFTHGEVHRGAARAGSLLLSRGVGPGDRVVIALPGSIEFVLKRLDQPRVIVPNIVDAIARNEIEDGPAIGRLEFGPGAARVADIHL